MSYLSNEIAVAQQDADSAAAAVTAAETRVGTALAAREQAAGVVAARQATLAAAQAHRATASSAAASAAGQVTAAQSALVQAQAAVVADQARLTDHDASEPEPPEPDILGHPPSAGEMAAYHKAHQAWEAAGVQLRQQAAIDAQAVTDRRQDVAARAAMAAQAQNALTSAAAEVDAASRAVEASVQAVQAADGEVAAATVALPSVRDHAGAAQQQLVELARLAEEVAREPFDRPALEAAAENLGARLAELVGQLAEQNALMSAIDGEVSSLSTRLADLQNERAQNQNALSSLTAQRNAAGAALPALQSAAQAADGELAAAGRAIADHRKNRPTRRPPNTHIPDWEPYDQDALDAWQAQLDGLAARQEAAVQAVAATGLALDARMEQLRSLTEQLDTVNADGARLAAALAAVQQQLGSDNNRREVAGEAAAALGPRISEVQVARETATTRLLGPVPLASPVLLLPIRLETVFRDTGGALELCVRAYPDDIHLDSHEPELTVAERRDGAHYHDAVAVAPDAESRELAWRQLADASSPQRAAWVALATDPAVAIVTGDRDSSWSRPARTSLLPDRFVFVGLARDGSVKFTKWGNLVSADPLPVGPAPQVSPGVTDPMQEAGAGWMHDFDAAVDAGMAVRVPVSPEQADLGFAKLFAIGLRAGLSDDASVSRLADALAAHHYTRGLALVPPGTASNNTDATRANYRARDPDGTRGFVAERGAPSVRANDGSDGDLLARALGLDPTQFAHVVGADGRWRSTEAALRTALAPVLDGALAATLGAAGASARAALFEAVCPGGPLPVLRVGAQPYGVLPTSSLARWTVEGTGSEEATLVEVLRASGASWNGPVRDVPHAGDGSELDTLLEQTSASLRWIDDNPSRVVLTRVRVGDEAGPMLEPDYVAAVAAATMNELQTEAYPSWPDATTTAAPVPLLYQLLRAARLATDGDPALAQKVDASLSELIGRPVAEFEHALSGLLDAVSHRRDAWVTALGTRRLSRLREAAPGSLRLGAFGWLENLVRGPALTPGPDGTVTRPGGLGHLLTPSLTHAATAAVLRSGWAGQGEKAGKALAVDVSSRRAQAAAWLLAGVRTGQPLGALLGYRLERALHDTGLDKYVAPLRIVAGLRGEDALSKASADVDTAGGKVDASSEIYDAAVEATARARRELSSAIANRDAVTALRDSRLVERSRLQAISDAAESARVRVIAADEAIRQHDVGRPKAEVVGDPGDVDNRGKPVKVLRTVDPQELKTWLERRAVLVANRALAVADAATARSLADANEAARLVAYADVARLNPLVEAASGAATSADQLVVARTGEESGAEQRLRIDEELLGAARDALATVMRAQWQRAMESVPARNVVDGLELRRRYLAALEVEPPRWDATTIPFGLADSGLPATSHADMPAIQGALDTLAETVDAVADVLIAESVHHLVAGNPLRSGATLDAVARGEAPPPELEVIRSPRSGITVTHRVLVLIEATVAPMWGPTVPSIRAIAEPRLDAWASRLLPEPSTVRCRVDFRSDNDARILASTEVTLDEIGLGPLDLLYVCDPRRGDAEIEQRVVRIATGRVPPAVAGAARPVTSFARDDTWAAETLSVEEFRFVLAEVNQLLAKARALDATDLATPHEAAEAGVDASELRVRADAVMDFVQETRAALDAAIASGNTADLDHALHGASRLGVPGGFPLATTAAEVLSEQAISIRDELVRRLDAAAGVTAVDAQGATARLNHLLGDELLVLPRCSPADPNAVSSAFGKGDDARLAGGTRPDAVGWLTSMSHVRPAVAALGVALGVAEAFDRPERLDLHVGQLPARDPDRWVGLTPLDGQPIAAGRVSLVAHTPTGFDFGSGQLTGLLVDEWTETLPAAREVAGLTFHYDAPGARAPQVMLLAVAPDLTPDREPNTWDLDTLADVVSETLELARERVVEPSALQRAGGPASGWSMPDHVDLDRVAEVDGP